MSSAADGDREEARAWLKKAEDDLLCAQLIRERAGPDTVGCFLCQQAMEKALKAVLVLFGDDVPRTHDLVALERQVGNRAGALGVSQEDLAAWTDYAVAARYPGFGDPQAERDLPAMCDQADALIRRVTGLIA